MNSTQAYILTGSNLGERDKQLACAAHLLNQKIGEPIKKSAIYETAAWGNTNQPAFLNQVLVYETHLNGNELLNIMLNAEKEMGRVRSQKWAERTIDIDLLFLGNQIIAEEHLKVPHPLMHKRKFTLIPLLEVAPYLIHPILGKNIEELLEHCDDTLEVNVW